VVFWFIKGSIKVYLFSVFLKRVFLQDRLTVQEREREEAKQRQAEREAQQAAELRRRETLRMVEEAVKKETTERKAKDNDPAG